MKNLKTLLWLIFLFLGSVTFLFAQKDSLFQKYNNLKISQLDVEDGLAKSIPIRLSTPFDTSFSTQVFSLQFTDESAMKSPEEMMHLYRQGNFFLAEKFLPNESRIIRSRTNYWQVLKFINLSSDTLRPLIFRPECTFTKIYALTSEKPQLIGSFGREVRMGELRKRNVSNRFAQTLKLPPGNSEFLILIRSELTKDKDLGLQLFDLGHFYHKFGKTLIYQYLFAGVVFGFFFFMFTYSVIQFFQTRNESYLYYCFYLFAVQWFYLREFDLTNLLIHTVPAWANSYQVYIYSTVLIYITYLQFVRVFLETKERIPGIHRFIKTATWSLVGFLLVQPFLRAFEADWLIFTCVKYAFQISSIYVLVALAKSQTPLAKYVLFGSLCLALGAILSMNSYFIVSGDWIEYDTLPGVIGVILENMFFIAGLSYKSKLLAKEKEKAVQALKQVEKEKALKTQLSNLKTRFFANITHEFRTPLTVILGLAEEVKKHPERDFLKRLNLIKKNGFELLELVNQMLELTSLEAGKHDLNLEQGDLRSFLKMIVASYTSFAELKQLNLNFHSDESEIIMDFDAEKIKRILTNLISNALKFTPAGGKISVSAKVSPRSKNETLEITVSDNGKGISEEDLPNIFKRFYHENSTGKNGFENTGIGLALVKELVELLGGKISAESEPDIKTTFTVLLPMTQNAPFSKKENQVAKQFAGSEIASNLSIASTADAPTLLIVEDNPELIYFLESCLADQYQILKTENGKLGIEKAIENIPDIIISDVMMPEADGFELCKTLKTNEATSHIPIILLTARTAEEDKIEGLSHGADAYLAKPFNREELLIRLEKLVASRKAMQRKYADLVGLKIENPTEPESAFLKKANEVLEKNYSDEKFGVADFCTQIFYSRVQVHRKLKALTDKNTSGFIRSFRLKKAAHFLKTTELPIAQIASRCGFSGIARFNQSFKEEFSQTPSDFRK